MRRNRGFSLIELMIAFAIMGLVISWLMEVFTTQQRAYVVVDQVTDAQQSARAVAQLLEHDLRMAGFMVPESAAVCGWDASVAPDTLFVSDSTAFRTLDQLFALDQAGGTSLAAGELGTPVVTPASIAGGTPEAVTLTRNYVDVAADGADFSAGAGMIIVDRNDPNGRSSCGIITAANPGASYQVNFNGNALAPSAAPDLVAIPAHVYQVVPTAAGVPQLFRNGALVTDHLEDFQIAYFFDANDDRVVDPGEFHGDGVAPNANYSPTLANGDDLRSVRANLVVTTRDPDPDPLFVFGAGQIMENRNPASLPAQDRMRRRIHTATVRIRNVGNN